MVIGDSTRKNAGKLKALCRWNDDWKLTPPVPPSVFLPRRLRRRGGVVGVIGL